MRAFLLLLLGLLVSLPATPSRAAPQERRVAFVVGNSAYRNFPALQNPRNDAEDMTASLKRFGFEVHGGSDLTRQALRDELRQFARSAQGADAALVFYAGHGLQYRGRNYLVPIDAKLQDEFDLDYETVRVDDVVEELNRADGAKILILDACRNLPLAGKSSKDAFSSTGLAKLSGRGLIVAYATQANAVAYDGSGRNSIFTSAFLKAVQEPGLDIPQLFQRVSISVDRVTNGKQTPELSLSYPGQFFFNRGETDREAWPRVRSSGDPDALRDFIARFPNSFLVDDAKDMIARLEDDKRRPGAVVASREVSPPAAAPRVTADDAASIRKAKDDADRLAWQALQDEQRRRAEARQRGEQERTASDTQDKQRQADAEAKRLADERRAADQARIASEQARAASDAQEKQRLAAEARQRDDDRRRAAEQAAIDARDRQRLADADKKRLADEQRAADQARVADEARQRKLAEEQAKADAVEKRRLAEEDRKRQADEKRLEQVRLADEARQRKLADDQAKADAAERQRLADADRKRLADEARATEQARLAELARQRQTAEQQAKADADARQQAAEAEKRRLAEQARAAEQARHAELARQRQTAEQQAKADAELRQQTAEAERRRLADEARAAEQTRLAELARQRQAADEQRAAEQARMADASRQRQFADDQARQAKAADLAAQAERDRLAWLELEDQQKRRAQIQAERSVTPPAERSGVEAVAELNGAQPVSAPQSTATVALAQDTPPPSPLQQTFAAADKGSPAGMTRLASNDPAQSPTVARAPDSAFPRSALDEETLVRSTEAELGRIGCYAQMPSSRWTGGSQAALARFVRQAKLGTVPKGPTQDILDDLKNRPAGFCPIECGRGEVAEGDRCVAVAKPKEEPRPVVERKAPRPKPVAQERERAEPRPVAQARPRPAPPQAPVSTAAAAPKPAARPMLGVGF